MDSKVKLINQNMFTWTSTRGWNYQAAHKSGFFLENIYKIILIMYPLFLG